MMDFRYDNANDAQQQLDSSTVMTEHGYAVHLRYAGNWDWQITNLETGDSEVMDIRKAGINFAPLELGYVNHNNGLSYITRNPKRMWKQGLTYDHITAVRGYIEENFLEGYALNNTLTNKFPTLKEAYPQASEEGVSVAFHRDFAINCEQYPLLQLEYKATIVGIINDELDFEISEKYHYIKELLEEVIHEKG